MNIAIKFAAGSVLLLAGTEAFLAKFGGTVPGTPANAVDQKLDACMEKSGNFNWRFHYNIETGTVKLSGFTVDSRSRREIIEDIQASLVPCVRQMQGSGDLPKGNFISLQNG